MATQLLDCCSNSSFLMDDNNAHKNARWGKKAVVDVLQAALVALLKLCPDMPLERKLPDGYRETWLEAIGNLSQQGESCWRQLRLTWANMGLRRLMIRLATLHRMHCTFNFQVIEFTKCK